MASTFDLSSPNNGASNAYQTAETEAFAKLEEAPTALIRSGFNVSQQTATIEQATNLFLAALEAGDPSEGISKYLGEIK